MISDISDEIRCERLDDKVRFEFDGVSTGWMSQSDPFIERISSFRLNRSCFKKHILKEFEIKSILDEGNAFLRSENNAKAIECFDEVIFYDEEYGEALIAKSHALFAQKHFVKALRYYRRGAKASSDLNDVEFHRTLLAKSGKERDAFSKLKRNIYAGDEYFSKGDYGNALESYDRALADTSRQKEKILFKLLNKKAAACIRLNDFESALACFDESLNHFDNDCAWYGKGVCEYELGHERACESLSRAVKIKKSQLLEKGLILNELECYSQAFETFSFLLENHFREDEMYIKAVNGKELAESALDSY